MNTNSKQSLTHTELLSLVNYNPATGHFTRIRSRMIGLVGKEIGSKEPHGYIIVGVKGKTYTAHRLAWFYMTGQWPSKHIDHKDRVRHNNKWDNLREADPRENGANASISKRNKSGIKGVCWDKKANKWRAYCRLNYKLHNLGYFNTKEDAGRVRDAFARQHFGEFYTMGI